MTAPTLRRVTPTGVLVLTAAQMEDRDMWLAERRKGIGSSDVPAILGLDDAYNTAVHVWRDKRGDDVDTDNEAALWGRLNEGTIAQEWCRRNRSVIDRIGLVAHQDHLWQLASLDRRVRECPLDRTVRSRCGLEVKTRSAFKSARWHKEAPDDVLAQVMWQLLITGYDHMHWAVLIGGNDYRQGVITRDPQLETYIADTVSAFRERYIIADVEPAWDWTKAARLIELDERLNPERNGDLDLDSIGEVMEYAEISARKVAAEKELKVARAKLAQLARGRRYMKFANELAYELSPVTRSNCDLDRLAEDFPDAYDACVTEKTTHQIRINPQLRKKGDDRA